MSFILEALRKAERHRQHSLPPALRLATADRRERAPPTRRFWQAALLAVLAVNGAALWWLWPVPNEQSAQAPVLPPVDAVAPAPAPAPAPALTSTPALSLDIHVYSDQPRRRFVLINGSRYQEGDRLNEGPLLETITPDGARLIDRHDRLVEISVER